MLGDSAFSYQIFKQLNFKIMFNKKQTALQKLHTIIKKGEYNFLNTELMNFVSKIDSNIEELLAKEKKQIETAFNEGMIKENSLSQHRTGFEAEKYYNETFKTINYEN